MEVVLGDQAPEYSSEDSGIGDEGEARRRTARAAALHKLPEAKLTEGVSIDDYSTYRATRFADPNEIG